MQMIMKLFGLMVFCISVVKHTAWRCSHPDGPVKAQKSGEQVADGPEVSAVRRYYSGCGYFNLKPNDRF
jgi:hypothetical protein